MTFRKIRFLGILLVIAMVSPVSVWAQNARIGFYRTDYPSPSACAFDLIPGLNGFIIRLDATSGPVSRVRLKVEFSTSGAYIYGGPPNGEVDVTFPYFIHAGDMVEHFVIIATVPGVTLPCTMRIVPFPGATNIELTDSEGNPMIGAWTHDSPDCSSRADWIAPYLPVPPNGATAVPTNQLLSYSGPATTVVLGTNPVPDPDDPASIICTNYSAPAEKPQCVVPIDPGSLLPLTTYYWRAYNLCSGCEQGEGAMSDIFSFTTGEGPLAIKPASWGSVKAIYRD